MSDEQKTEIKVEPFDATDVDELVRAFRDMGSVRIVEDSAVKSVDVMPDHVTILFGPKNDDAWDSHRRGILRGIHQTAILKDAVFMGLREMFLPDRNAEAQANVIMIRGGKSAIRAMTNLFRSLKTTKATPYLRRFNITVGGTEGRAGEEYIKTSPATSTNIIRSPATILPTENVKK